MHIQGAKDHLIWRPEVSAVDEHADVEVEEFLKSLHAETPSYQQ